MNTDTRTGFTWKHVSWLTWLLAGAAVIAFLAVASPAAPSPYPIPYATSGSGGAVAPTEAPMPADTSAQSTAGGVYNGYMPVRYPPYYGGTPNANDTREFDKITYNASMQTRDVQSLETRVATVVRGHAGRVDSEQASPTYGYVSFVVPMSQYDAFRAELESLVPSRFLTVNINSQNLLPQKQTIEQQQQQASSTLAQYQTQRSDLMSAHAKTVQSIQAQLNPLNQQLSNLQEQAPNTEVAAQIQFVQNQIAALNAQLANENASYQSQLASYDSQIKSIQQWQQAVTTQDQNLMDNVATVNGSITLAYINLWQWIQAYLPGYWIPFILALAAGVSLWFDRRRYYARVLV